MRHHERPPLVRGKARASTFLLLIAGFFGVMVLVFDAVIVSQLAAGISSWDFVQVPGVVTRSEVATETSSNSSGSSTSYRPRIEYRYEAGQEYEGDRVSFVEWGSGDYDAALEVVKAYPVDAEIDIYVDENDPSISVLQPGIDRFPSLVLLFLLPFHCVVAVLLLFRRHTQYRADTKTLLANMLQDEGGGRATLRPLPMALGLRFALLLLGFSFVSTFAVAIAFGMNPGFGVVLPILLVLAGAAFGIALWWHKGATHPKHTTRFDDSARKLSLGGMTEADEFVLAYDELKELSVLSKDAGTVNGVPIMRHELHAYTTRGEELILARFRGEYEAGDELLGRISERTGAPKVEGE